MRDVSLCVVERFDMSSSGIIRDPDDPPSPSRMGGAGGGPRGQSRVAEVMWSEGVVHVRLTMSGASGPAAPSSSVTTGGASTPPGQQQHTSLSVDTFVEAVRCHADPALMRDLSSLSNAIAADMDDPRAREARARKQRQQQKHNNNTRQAWCNQSPGRGKRGGGGGSSGGGSVFGRGREMSEEERAMVFGKRNTAQAAGSARDSDLGPDLASWSAAAGGARSVMQNSVGFFNCPDDDDDEAGSGGGGGRRAKRSVFGNLRRAEEEEDDEDDCFTSAVDLAASVVLLGDSDDDNDDNYSGSGDGLRKGEGWRSLFEKSADGGQRADHELSQSETKVAAALDSISQSVANGAAAASAASTLRLKLQVTDLLVVVMHQQLKPSSPQISREQRYLRVSLERVDFAATMRLEDGEATKGSSDRGGSPGSANRNNNKNAFSLRIGDVTLLEAAVVFGAESERKKASPPSPLQNQRFVDFDRVAWHQQRGDGKEGGGGGRGEGKTGTGGMEATVGETHFRRPTLNQLWGSDGVTNSEDDNRRAPSPVSLPRPVTLATCPGLDGALMVPAYGVDTGGFRLKFVGGGSASASSSSSGDGQPQHRKIPHHYPP